MHTIYEMPQFSSSYRRYLCKIGYNSLRYLLLNFSTLNRGNSQDFLKTLSTRQLTQLLLLEDTVLGLWQSETLQ